MPVAAGTRIQTPRGAVTIETISIGDQVIGVADGAEECRRVVWTGRRTLDVSRHARPHDVCPVRILAGAFEPGLPERDLWVSADHALFLDGQLMAAGSLVNGATVARDAGPRLVTYHHIELDRHDVLLAEGLAVESGQHAGQRAMFAQDGAPVVLHPDFTPASRRQACAKFLAGGPVVTAARRILLGRAVALGFESTDAIDLVAKVGVEKIQPQPGDGGAFTFALPAGAVSVALLCGAGVPAEMLANAADTRALGAAITSLALLTAAGRRELPLEGDYHGFHALQGGMRWTDGAARVALPDYAGPATLVVTLQRQAPRWRAAPAKLDLMTL